MYGFRLAAGAGAIIALWGANNVAMGAIDAGPGAVRFPLVLAPGSRTEILGPLFNYEQKESQTQFGIPPVFSYTVDPSVQSQEFDLGYPVLTYDRFGDEYRLQLFQIISFSGGKNQSAVPTSRFSLFPLYFQQRSADTNQNYTAVVPFYGTLKNRFMRDEVHFVLLPLYVSSRKADVRTDNYLFPIFHVRHGNQLSGWQLWPLIGHEHKNPTTRTNILGEAEVVGGHQKFFALWPLVFNQTDGIGTDNPVRSRIVLPFFSWQRSPKRDSTTYVWPLFTFTNDREKKYREWDLPWPLVVFARGEGKTANRIWPIFSHAQNTNLESQFYLWPLYKNNRFHSSAGDRERTRILFYLYSDVTETIPGTNTALRRTDFWPLFTARRDHQGNERLQLFAPAEPFLPNNKSIERSYSPIWSIWRSDKNAKTGASSQSFLWNLYRFDRAGEAKKCSLLFGLFQYQSDPNGRRWRLFYIPIGKAKPGAPPPSRP